MFIFSTVMHDLFVGLFAVNLQMELRNYLYIPIHKFKVSSSLNTNESIHDTYISKYIFYTYFLPICLFRLICGTGKPILTGRESNLGYFFGLASPRGVVRS